jgi:hypothetical protein
MQNLTLCHVGSGNPAATLCITCKCYLEYLTTVLALADMKATVLISVMFVASIATAQTTRDYFKELYGAGGLDRLADHYVCFDDQPAAQTFFIFAESRLLRQFLLEDGSFYKLSKGEQAALSKDYLMLRFYDKGIAQPHEEFLSKDGGSWISEKLMPVKNHQMRIRFTVQWQTMRYRRSVEIFHSDSTFQSEISSYGRCEEIPAGVHQKGE